MYIDDNNRKEWSAYWDKQCEDELATEFAKNMIPLYQPDKAYTLDVCKVKAGGYKLIEINSFFCASWYGNDLTKIVKAVNELCIDEYNDVYE